VLLRAELERFGGRKVATTGDGLFATLPVPPVRSAVCAMRDAVHSLGLEIRVGLHTGEVETVGPDRRGWRSISGRGWRPRPSRARCWSPGLWLIWWPAPGSGSGIEGPPAQGRPRKLAAVRRRQKARRRAVTRRLEAGAGLLPDVPPLQMRTPNFDPDGFKSAWGNAGLHSGELLPTCTEQVRGSNPLGARGRLFRLGRVPRRQVLEATFSPTLDDARRAHGPKNGRRRMPGVPPLALADPEVVIDADVLDAVAADPVPHQGPRR
jgi:hypothetical protein